MRSDENLPEIDYLELAIVYHRDRIYKNIERTRHWIARDIEKGTRKWTRKFNTPQYLQRNTRIMFSYNERDFARELTPEYRKLLDKILEE